MSRCGLIALACAGFFAGTLDQAAEAQGLIVRLPKDGAWVRFEGTVKQVEFRPDAPEGDISMEWIEHLTIKSVGREQALYHGKQVPCRWIEIKAVTGKPSESGVEAGPVGERLYKILVPEERVVGAVADGEKIPFSFLDIIKGFRKIGGTVTPLPLTRGSEGAFQAYPLVGPLMHYDTMEATGSAAEEVQVPGGKRAREEIQGAARDRKSDFADHQRGGDLAVRRRHDSVRTRTVVDENHHRQEGQKPHRGRPPLSPPLRSPSRCRPMSGERGQKRIVRRLLNDRAQG